MLNQKQIYLNIWLLIFFFLCQTFAQSNISTDVLSVRDGLSNNKVPDIIQDQYGYMWIATIDGLNRYDGYENIVIKNIPGDSTSLPHNRTYNLFEDSEGTIWVSTENGLARYNRKRGTFTTFKYSKSNAEGSNRVFHIYEDSRKMMWVASMEGTFEFDRIKEKFKKYDIVKTDNSIIEYNGYCGIIAENIAGELYNLSWSNGLLSFDYDDSVFTQIALKDNFNEYLTEKVYFDADFDPDNNLWIGISDGLVKVNFTEMTGYDITPFKKGDNPSNWSVNGATGLYLDRNENMWVATGRNGMFIFDRNKQKFEKLINNVSTHFSRFYEDNSGLLWFGSSRGAQKYDFDKEPFEQYTLGNDLDENRTSYVRSFAQSHSFENLIWLGTGKGVAQFNKNNSQVTQKLPQFRELSKLDTIEISSLVESSDNFLWVATSNQGLFSMNLKSGQLKNYKNIYNDTSSLASNFINSLARDKNDNLWIGTPEGLQVLRKDKKSFGSIPWWGNKRYERSLISKLNALREKSTPINSIIEVGNFADISKEFVVREDTKVLINSLGEGNLGGIYDFGWLESNNGDTLWIASDNDESFYAGGHLKNRIKIGLMDLKPGRYTLRYKSDDSHSADSFNRVPPPDSTYWGIEIYPLTDKEFEWMSQVLKYSEEKPFLNGGDIEAIFPDSKNNLWVGTGAGLSKIDTDFQIENYSNDPADNSSLSSNRISDINEDLQGNIWIATRNGLNKFDPVKKSFSVLYERDGLPSSNLSAIEVDNQGNLWVSSLKGISKIEINELVENQIIINYDAKDGLQGYEFISNSSFKDKNGKLYFSGYDGFNAFYPRNSNRTPPNLVIQDIKFSNKSIDEIEQFENLDINQLAELSLAHDQNDLSFEFASIHFSRPDKNRLMYKLEGIDEDWIINNRRFATYTNLSPGDYTFNLRGSNGDGIWSDETKKINIHIAAPWYNNWIAYSVYGLIFFGLLFSVRKFEMRRQQKNAQIAESRLKIETAEALAKAADSDKRALQVEFNQKKKELDEARELQLSMLPKDLPELPNLDIAVYMKTATEVGGDYYDFHIDMNGTLTVVLGDATGHGMKAGTMVTTTKSLFNVLAPNPNIVETFHEMTRCLKLMQMQNLSMCMTMLKIMGNRVTMSAAGMPPIFLYKRENQSTEEHVIKGMPLGTFSNFPYKTVESELNSGDSILLMSDGFPELQNENKEMFGYKRVRNLFEDLADQSPEEIITNLKNAGSEWVKNADPDDDVTFVVIKVK